MADFDNEYEQQNTHETSQVNTHEESADGLSMPPPNYQCFVPDGGDGDEGSGVQNVNENEVVAAETIEEEVQQIDIATYLTGLGAIRTEDERNAAITQINTLYPSTEETPNQLNILLTNYVNQGYAAVVSLPENQDVTTEFKQAGFDAMAAYIAENTSMRRSGSNYNYTSATIRISQDEQLMRVLHQIGYWQDLDRRVVNAATALYDDWTPQADEGDDIEGARRDQMEESDAAASERLSEIWGVTRGPNGRARMSRLSAQNTDNSYWSAVTIAHIMDQAGAGDTFSYGDTHTIFGNDAKNNEISGADVVTNPSRLRNAEGESPESLRPGVIMHRNRSGTNVDYDSLRSGQSSHSDVIVAIEVFDASSARLFSSYEDLKSNVRENLPAEQQATITPAALEAATQAYITSNNYQLFAVSVGGNTNDENAPTITDDEDGNRSILYNKRSGQTVGRRYWPLNTDRTINNGLNRSNAQVYGVQTWDNPTEGELAGAETEEAIETE